MSLIDDNSTQTLYKRTRQGADADAEWEGTASLYDPPVGEDPEAFICVYEPQYFDRGRDFAATGNGRVLTEAEFKTGDLVVTRLAEGEVEEERQEVTQVNPLYGFDGSLDFYEVYL